MEKESGKDGKEDDKAKPDKRVLRAGPVMRGVVNAKGEVISELSGHWDQETLDRDRLGFARGE